MLRVQTKLEYISKTEQDQMKNYKNFQSLKEVRRPKKCPILSFKPLRQSEVYQDMIAMGFVERLEQNPAGIEGTGTEEQRYFKDRLGNLGFFHPKLSTPYQAQQQLPYYNIQHDGAITICRTPSSSDPVFVPGQGAIKKVKGEFPHLVTNLNKRCMTFEDYYYKMGFLIKLLIQRLGFPISDVELRSDESYKDLIRRKLEEDPSVAGKLTTVPPSLQQEDLGKGTSMLKKFGLFDED